MVSAELSARLRFLNESAHLLATTAPATSRQLMSRCNALMFDNDLDSSEAHRRTACGACGTIMIVGWEGTMKTDTKPVGRTKVRKDGQGVKKRKALVYNCETCGKKTRFPLDASSPAHRHKSTSLNQRLTAPSQAMTTPSSAPSILEAKSSSKKRAKARKRGGLEAILAAKNLGDPPGFGLDLMDFMKKS